MHSNVFYELQNMLNFNVLHVLLQKKARNKAIACCVVMYEELINSRDNVYCTPGF